MTLQEECKSKIVNAFMEVFECCKDSGCSNESLAVITGLVNKAIERKPLNDIFDGAIHICPTCQKTVFKDFNSSHCQCGQRLDWSNRE